MPGKTIVWLQLLKKCCWRSSGWVSALTSNTRVSHWIQGSSKPTHHYDALGAFLGSGGRLQIEDNMSDDKTKRHRKGRRKINVHENSDLDYWSEKLPLPPDKL